MLKTLTVLFITLAEINATQAQDCNSSKVGYPTPAAALQALQKKPGVAISVQGGWTIVNDRPTLTVWSFTPSAHQAHPAVVRRTAIKKDGAFYVCTSVLCGGPKPACDKLVAEFNELNNRMRRDLESKRNPKT